MFVFFYYEFFHLIGHTDGFDIRFFLNFLVCPQNYPLDFGVRLFTLYALD